jgi:hypothetical protein
MCTRCRLGSTTVTRRLRTWLAWGLMACMYTVALVALRCRLPPWFLGRVCLPVVRLLGSLACRVGP